MPEKKVVSEPCTEESFDLHAAGGFNRYILSSPKLMTGGMLGAISFRYYGDVTNFGTPVTYAIAIKHGAKRVFLWLQNRNAAGDLGNLFWFPDFGWIEYGTAAYWYGVARVVNTFIPSGATIELHIICQSANAVVSGFNATVNYTLEED